MTNESDNKDVYIVKGPTEGFEFKDNFDRECALPRLSFLAQKLHLLCALIPYHNIPDEKLSPYVDIIREQLDFIEHLLMSKE